jgi:hypothetical protein
MGHKSKSTTPAQPPAQPPPPPADCASEPQAPDTSDGHPGLNLSSLFGTVSKLAHDVGSGELLDGAGFSAGADDSEGDCSSSGISIHVGTAGDDGGKPLLSLHSGSDAELTVPVFGEEGVFDDGLLIDGMVGSDEESITLVSLDGESNAIIEAPIFAAGAEEGSGVADVGSLLNLAMLKVGNIGALGAISGGDVYDGNIPLAGDLSSALDSTLDMLTTTTSLFDVPVLDMGGCDTLDG